MKKLIAIIALILGLNTGLTFAAGNVKITFKYKCTNIVEGYDHLSRLKVYVDGKIAGTSSEKLESQENTITVELSKGEHSIRAILESQYEGAWEEHTIANTYSIDCLYEITKKFTKKNTLVVLEFNIDVGTIIKKK